MSQTDDAGIAGPQVRVRRALDGRVGRDRARPLGHLMLRRAAQDLPPEQLPVRPDGPHAGAGRLGARRRAHDGRPRRPRTRRRHDDDDARAAPARSNDGRHRRRRSHLRRNRSLTRAASLSKRQNLASRAPNSLSLVRRSFSRCVWIHFRARASRQASRRSRSSSRPRSPRWPPACPRERRQTTGPKERERERRASPLPPSPTQTRSRSALSPHTRTSRIWSPPIWMRRSTTGSSHSPPRARARCSPRELTRRERRLKSQKFALATPTRGRVGGLEDLGGDTT